MDQPPRLAVVIANHNYERFVGKAIDSVLRQGRDDVELVVVDDGSSDASWSVISGYGDRFGAFRLVNGGQAAACLFGVERTSAPFILLLDADDELAPGALATIIDHLEPSVAKLQYALTPIDADGRVIGVPRPRLKAFRERAALVETIRREGEYVSPPTSGNVFRRDLFARIAPIDYETAIDGVILLLAPFLGDVISLDQPLGFYRLHGANFSAIDKVTPERFAREADRFAARLAHLSRILTPVERSGFQMPDATTLVFPAERRLYQAVAAGERPSLRAVRRLAGALAGAPRSLTLKLSHGALAASLWLLPAPQRVRLLGYRFNPGERTTRGLLRAMWRA